MLVFDPYHYSVYPWDYILSVIGDYYMASHLLYSQLWSPVLEFRSNKVIRKFLGVGKERLSVRIWAAPLVVHRYIIT